MDKSKGCSLSGSGTRKLLAVSSELQCRGHPPVHLSRRHKEADQLITQYKATTERKNGRRIDRAIICYVEFEYAEELPPSSSSLTHRPRPNPPANEPARLIVKLIPCILDYIRFVGRFVQ